jgi:hypothetical protein
VSPLDDPRLRGDLISFPIRKRIQETAAPAPEEGPEA